MEKIIALLAKYYPVFLKGFYGTIWISALTVLVGTVVGFIVALMRMGRFKLFNMIAKAYTDVLRGTPILLQLYFFWIALPKIMPFEMDETACIIAALTVNASSYISEIIRGGINAVDPGQFEAAQSLGMSKYNMMRKIIIPQAIKNILPALGNQFIMMTKETSLASVFFVGELMTSCKTVQSTTYLYLEALIIVGVIYFVLNYILSKALSYFEWRLKASD